jgi:diacylglycerol kinase family enzyme
MPQQRAVIIYNPMSGRAGSRAEDARHMISLLAARGIQADACATTGPDHATRLAREAVNDGVEIIISYGGDGTLNEVIQGMAQSRAALAVWPGGTSNVVARDLEMPFTIERIAEVIVSGKTQRIALGLATRKGVGEWGSEGVREKSSGGAAELRKCEIEEQIGNPAISPSPPLPHSPAIAIS